MRLTASDACSSALEEVPDDGDDRDDEKKVNQSTNNWKYEETEGPEDDENNRDREEHGSPEVKMNGHATLPTRYNGRVCAGLVAEKHRGPAVWEARYLP